MKKLVGTFKTEEEALLAINDLKDMGLNPHEITIMTNDPVAFTKIEQSFGENDHGMVRVGDIANGIGVQSFMKNLGHYGFSTEKADLYQNRLQLGSILVFIGVNEAIQHHIENPGSYMAKDLHIEDIETPGTYTLTPHIQLDPDNPGKYLAEEYDKGIENPGTYHDPHADEDILNPGTFQDPRPEDDILNPGTIKEVDELIPHHNMIQNIESPDGVTKKEDIYKNGPVDEVNPFNPNVPR